MQLRQRRRRARRLDAVVQREIPAPDDFAEIGPVAAFATELLGVDHFARREAHDQPATRAEPAAPHDRVVAEIHDAGFGRAQHLVARRATPAQWAQTRAVERRADRIAVGKHDGRRAVPRLDGGNVRVVVRAQPRVARIDRRSEQQIDGFVDTVARTDHRIDVRVEIVRVARTGERRDAARGEPGAVAGDRVDLAVVRDVTERLHEPPRRRRVRGEALVEEREARRELRIAEIVEVGTEFVGGE